MNNFIKELKSRNLMLNIVELGYGHSIADSIMQEDGASKLIYNSQSPYSKVAQEKLLKTKFQHRSVSIENAQALCVAIETDEVNITDVVITLQTGKKKDSHGWICVNQNLAIHFTIGYNFNKSDIRDIIKKILYFILFVPEKNIHSMGTFIDGIFIAPKATKLNTNEHFKPDLLPVNFHAFALIKGNWSRVTSLLRVSSTKINLIKGSFNPFHKGHASLFFVKSLNILSITTESTKQGKPSISTLEAINRVKRSQVDYAIIDSYMTSFKQLTDFLIDEYLIDKGRLELSMGSDVFLLFDPIPGIKTNVHVRTLPDQSVNFFVNKYSSLSSTQIRENSM